MPEDSGERVAGLWDKLWQRFGDVAKRMGLAAGEDVDDALAAQEEQRPEGASRKRVGHILVEKGKMEPAHVNKVLTEQRRDAGLIEAKAKKAKRAASAMLSKKKGAASKPKPAGKKAKAKPKAKAGGAGKRAKGKSKPKKKAKKKAKKAKKKG